MKLAWRPCRLGESITLEGSELGSHVGAALIGTLLMLALLLKVLSRGIYDHGFTLLCIILTLLNRRGGPQLPDTPMTPSPKWVLTPIIIQLYFWPSLYSKSVSKTKWYDITLFIRTDYLMDLQSEASKSSEWQWTVCSMIHLVYHLIIYSGSRASPTKRTKQVVYVLECDIIICLTLTITYKGHHQRPRARERERLLLPLSLIVRRIHSLLRVVQGMYLYVWMEMSC